MVGEARQVLWVLAVKEVVDEELVEFHQGFREAGRGSAGRLGPLA
jgi:hypothetical protein